MTNKRIVMKRRFNVITVCNEYSAAAPSIIISDDSSSNSSTAADSKSSSSFSSSSSLPSLCLENHTPPLSIDEETFFNSLLFDDKKTAVIDNDNNDEDTKDDLKMFCDSFFSEKNTVSTPKLPSPPPSSSTVPSHLALPILVSSNNSHDIGITKKRKSSNIISSKKKMTNSRKRKKIEHGAKTKVDMTTTTKNLNDKKNRTKEANNTTTTEMKKNNKFRPYQAEKWMERYEDLLQFRKEHGHCLVPHTYPPNPILARWVKRQRYQYKLFQMMEQSSMTNGRIQLLANVGFVWHSHEILWQERINELLIFKSQHGHCLVPSNYEPNPKLATWVKSQRRQYKLYLRGNPSNITEKRIAILDKHGFEWQLRSSTESIGKEIATHQKKLRSSMMKFIEKDNTTAEGDTPPSTAETSSSTIKTVDSNNYRKEDNVVGNGNSIILDILTGFRNEQFPEYYDDDDDNATIITNFSDYDNITDFLKV